MNPGLPDASAYGSEESTPRFRCDKALAAADDREIIQAAEARQAVVVTLDADFHRILALTGATAPSVIRFRIEGLRARELVDMILDILPVVEAELERGALVSVMLSKIRIHLLPVV